MPKTIVKEPAGKSLSGDRLRRLRTALGMNQAQLAKAAGVERNEISQAETQGKALTGRRMRDGLAQALRVPGPELSVFLSHSEDDEKLVEAFIQRVKGELEGERYPGRGAALARFLAEARAAADAIAVGLQGDDPGEAWWYDKISAELKRTRKGKAKLGERVLREDDE